jgi:hypothetical protein
MVYKFRLLSDEVDDFVREIAIDADATFLDLNNAILESTGYSTNEMTSFFLCNDDWEKETEITLIEMDNSPEEDNWVMGKTKLSELIDEEGQKLLFVFDYLRERAFFIELYQTLPNKKMDKPKCLRAEGAPPPQTTELDSLSQDSSLTMGLDESFYGDQEFDEDELDMNELSDLEDDYSELDDHDF